jgi:hypothetical protein
VPDRVATPLSAALLLLLDVTADVTCSLVTCTITVMLISCSLCHNVVTALNMLQHTYSIHIKLRYVSATRQLERVRGHADRGATWRLYYESCLQGIRAKQTTGNIIRDYNSAMTLASMDAKIKSLPENIPHCLWTHGEICHLISLLYPNGGNKPGYR